MPFQLSPGVAVVEKDFTSIVPAVSTSAGAFAGSFAWGPVMDPVTITSENVLVQRFGQPNDLNAQSFFTAANFLSYANNLLLVRTDAPLLKNAVAVPSGTVTSVNVSNAGSGYTTAPTVTFTIPDLAGGITATGTAVLSGGEVTSAAVADGGSGYSVATVSFSAPERDGGITATGTVSLTGDVVTSIVITDGGSGYLNPPTATISGDGTGALAGIITISSSSIDSIIITEGGTGYTTAPGITIADPVSGVTAIATATTTLSGIKINNFDEYNTNWVNGAGVVGPWAAKYPGTLGNSIKVSMADAGTYAGWTYASEFTGAPATSSGAATAGGSNDELHIIVIDEDGKWTGVRGSVLEKYAFVSKANDNKKSDGTNNYYRDVINSQSRYIWWMDHPVDDVEGEYNWTGLTSAGAFESLLSVAEYSLTGGVDDFNSTDAQKMNGFDIFANDELYDISLIPIGKASSTVANYVISNVAEVRRDCIAFVSPEDNSTGDIIIGNLSENIDSLITYRNALPSSSYAVMDSGYKYQYDRYNDKYRWVPLNGDIAGLCARTDYTDDPWYSPGGLNRGQIKNVVKLAVQPGKVARDSLYTSGINPVVSFPGQGTVLYGDKTLLARPSAFDRINVRRLFIVLEKAIATAAKFQLFEFNDSFTRAQFRNLVEPFLRDVQGRRGVTDFRVKCDESNNTGEIIDRNEFIADIFIKPNRSINFITLNFIAARSSVSFDEIGA